MTEFLIKSYPHAETLSFVAFVFIKDSNDLRQLVKAGQDGKYAINILQPLYFRRPKPSMLVSITCLMELSFEILSNSIFSWHGDLSKCLKL